MTYFMWLLSLNETQETYGKMSDDSQDFIHECWWTFLGINEKKNTLLNEIYNEY